MKEASGELNMTLVTIIAIAAIAGLIYVLKDPIMDAIKGKWTETSNCTKYNSKGECTAWK